MFGSKLLKKKHNFLLKIIYYALNINLPAGPVFLEMPVHALIIYIIANVKIWTQVTGK